jgi:hypothetical protein
MREKKYSVIMCHDSLDYIVVSGPHEDSLGEYTTRAYAQRVANKLTEESDAQRRTCGLSLFFLN